MDKLNTEANAYFLQVFQGLEMTAPARDQLLDVQPLHPVYNLAAAPANDMGAPVLDLQFG